MTLTPPLSAKMRKPTKSKPEIAASAHHAEVASGDPSSKPGPDESGGDDRAARTTVSVVSGGDRLAADAITDVLKVALRGWNVASRPPVIGHPGEQSICRGGTVLLWRADEKTIAGFASRPFRYRIAVACDEPAGVVWLRSVIGLDPTAIFSREEGLETLIKSVQSAALGTTYVSPALQERVEVVNGRMVVRDVGGASSLTQRQCEVLRMFALGFSIRETATALELTEKTVESHRYRVCKRLGVHDRSGLVEIAIREGLLSMSAG